MAALQRVMVPEGSSTDLLFRDISPERISVAFARACRKVKIQDSRFHDLRHTAVPIPAMPITHSDLMAITIPSDADHRRSEATLDCSYHAEVIGIRQAFCC